MTDRAEVVICGAGIAGVAAAYFLSVQHGVKDIVLVDALPPLSLTSDKSTECYRNWWPGPGNEMVGLMNRSIDLLEDIAIRSANRINLNRRGYLFATADNVKVDQFVTLGEEASQLGAGVLRQHPSSMAHYQPSVASGFSGQPVGSDLLLGKALVQQHFPYLSDETIAVLHARRCGWFSAQQLGMYLLNSARDAGTRLVNGQVVDVRVEAGRVTGVTVKTPHNERHIATPNFVNAAGPYLKPTGALVGVDVPVFSECHVKVSFKDTRDAVPVDAPLMIWCDPVSLPWSDAERDLLAENEETRYLLASFQSGVHVRPEGHPGGHSALILWTYECEAVAPLFPLQWDRNLPDIALRGLSVMLPSMQAYFDVMPKTVVDGGYYTKTQENRPLIGPMPVAGSFVIGAFSGFGLMVGCGAGDLLARHLTGAPLPEYAHAFTLQRYANPAYQRLLADWPSTSGQL